MDHLLSKEDEDQGLPFFVSWKHAWFVRFSAGPSQALAGWRRLRFSSLFERLWGFADRETLDQTIVASLAFMG